MGAPRITFTFQRAAEAVAARLKGGIVGLILRDDGAAAGLYTAADETDLPPGLSAQNRDYALQALRGSRGRRPTKLLLSVMAADGDGDLVAGGAAAFAATQVDYIAGPPDMTADEAAAVKAWLETARSGYFVGKLVAADYAADSMAVVNLCASDIVSGGVTYTGAAYCARIAGVLASTDLSSSATFAPLEEVTAVGPVADLDEAINAGKLILVHDGVKAKLSRAVNSLTTVPAGQSESLKKIKVVEAVDLIRSYAMRLIEDTFVGRSNGYGNKTLLVSTLQAFLSELETEGVLAGGSANAAIDLDAQRSWLKEHGADVASMSDDALLKADTGSEIFVALEGTILDAMEDFRVCLTMGGNL